MQKIKVLILGATGMAGSMIEKVLSTDNALHLGITTRTREGLFLGMGYDVYKFDAMKDVPFFAKNYDYIINCVGAIPNAKPTPEEYVKLNTLFPIELAKNCKDSKIIHLTTDCVFDEGKLPQNDEMSADHSRDYYAKSKHLGEVLAPNVMNLRCSILGPERFTKNSFLERFIEADKHVGWTNVGWNGITTYHLAQIVKGVIKNDLFSAGCHHLVPSGSVSKFEMMSVLNEFYWGTEKKEIFEGVNPKELNRELVTLNPVKNLLLWNSAGYAAAPNFISMICELHKMFWLLGFAEERGAKKL
jgi:dTDP-4-dehydrorhamnose reductase